MEMLVARIRRSGGSTRSGWVGLLVLLAMGSWVAPQSENLAESYYHFSRAKMLQFRDELPAAVAEFRKALELNPASVDLRLEFAETLLQAGENSRAVEVCEEALRMRPSDATLHTRVAELILQAGEIARAVELCRTAIEVAPDSVDARLLLGRIFYSSREQSGMRDKALAEFEAALRIDPYNQEAMQYAADLHFQSGRYQEAADLFARLRQSSPGSIKGYYFEAQALVELNRIDAAISTLEKGLELRDDIPEYVLLLAGLYRSRGDLESAEEIYRRALANGPDPRLNEGLARTLVALGKGEEAIPVLERLTQVQPGQQELRLDLARAYRQGRQLTKAAEVLEALLADDPESVQVNYEYSSVLLLMGEREKAADRLLRMLESERPTMRPYRGILLTNLALIREEEGRFDEAISLLEEARALSPGDLDARLRVFYTLQRASRIDEMQRLADELLKEAPEHPHVLIAHAQALAATGKVDEGVRFLQERAVEAEEAETLYLAASQLYLARDQFDGAQGVVEAALSRLPESERLQFQLGAVLERQKDYDGAERRFLGILDRNPDHADVLNYLGYMLADRGVRLDEALDYIRRAVELDPYNGAFQDSLGWVYFKQDDLVNAELHLKKAVRLQRADPVILEHLGDLYVRKGEAEEARRYYEMSIRHAEKAEESDRVRLKLETLLTSMSGK